MDSKKALKNLVIIAVAVQSFACSKQQAEEVFPLESQSCLEKSVANEYLVSWNDGRISVEYGDDRDSFLNDFVETQLDQIRFVETNKEITLDPMSNPDFVFVPGEIDNWGAESVGAAHAWSKDIRGQGVTVAVVDSGVDRTHSQLEDRIFINDGETGLDEDGNDRRSNGVDDDNNGYIDDYSGYDFFADSGEVTDTSSHGTHVAGIIAAYHADTEVSTEHVQGIAPEATILPLDFIENGGTTSDAIRAIEYAKMMGAKVINASWGGGPCSTTLGEKITALAEHDVLFVSAAGNGQPGRDIDRYIEYPASFNLVSQITVGSITAYGGMARHSNYGDINVHLFAPGHTIYSTVPNQGVRALTGTSMATPFVSAAAALLWSLKPEATAQEIKSTILASVTRDSSYRNQTNGTLNIPQAIDLLENPIP